jgi:putative ABC transport system ATP-binding protein
LLDGITKTYRSKAGAVDALRGVTYHFARGSFTAVMGPSGSGKSTLLQCAAGLDQPTTGTVVLNGVSLGTLNEVELTKLRRSEMGFVFQAYNLLPSLTVYDNVALPLRLTGRRPARDDVLRVLEQVGLDGKAKRRPAELSGGQQQRVAIARALITQPSVFFADEPTGALDSGTSRQVLELLRAATDRAGQTVVMVTHDPVAAAYAERVLFLSDGLLAGHLDRATPAQIAAAMSELER